MGTLRLKWLMLPGLVLGACANVKQTTPSPNPRLVALQRQSDAISREAERCVNEATRRTDAQVARLTASGIDANSLRMRLTLDKGDGAIAKCKEDEAKAQAQVAASERAEYAREAQAERNDAALMSILTTSLGH
jgi:hypothetical protein